MCYAKPGPRCSSHARINLDKAISSGDPEAIISASDSYDETIKGQREIQERLEAATGNEKYDLEAKLASAKLRRKIKLKQYKNIHPDARITHDGRDPHQDDVAAQFPRISTPYSKDVEDLIKNNRIRIYSYSNFSTVEPSSVGIERNQPGCSGCEEPYDDYCRCVTYHEDTFDIANIDYVLKDVFNMDQNAVIPEEMKAWAILNGFGKKEAYYVKVEGDYYGDNIDVHLEPEYAAKARAYYEMHKTGADIASYS